MGPSVLVLASLLALAPLAAASAQSPNTATPPPPSPATRAPNPVTGQTAPDPRVSGREAEPPSDNTGGVRRGPTIPNTGTPRIMQEEPRER
jgi:hypothetical protein